MSNQTDPSDNPQSANHNPQSAIPRLNAAQWRSILAQSPLFFEVISDSMAPTFRAGEHVLIRALYEDEPRPGQILAYFRGQLITHRYLGDGVCLGDHALTEDPAIEPADMVGIVTGTKRNGRVVPLADRMPFRTRIHRLLIRTRHAFHSVRMAIKSCLGL